jgi:probable HAF family extracellular repeat protein
MNFQRKMMGVLLVGLFCLASLSAAINEPPRYRLLRLDEFVDYDGSADLLLNNRGQVTAMVHDEDSTPRLFIRGQRRTIELPLPATAGPALVLKGRTSGETILFDGGNGSYSAYLYRRRTLVNLTNILPYKYFNFVFMNNRGRIVGGAQQSEGPPITAFSFYRGRVRELGTLLPNTSSAALGANNRGQIVGASQVQTELNGNPIGVYHAVIFGRNKVKDLGSLEPGQSSVATHISSRGAIIGYSSVTEPTDEGRVSYRRAFVHQEGVMRQLFPLPGHVRSEANGINRRGQIVGLSIDEHGEATAVLFLNGETFDLNELIAPDNEVELREALSINDRGVIAAVADGGESFLLIPE